MIIENGKNLLRMHIVIQTEFLGIQKHREAYPATATELILKIISVVLHKRYQNSIKTQQLWLC